LEENFLWINEISVNAETTNAAMRLTIIEEWVNKAAEGAGSINSLGVSKG